MPEISFHPVRLQQTLGQHNRIQAQSTETTTYSTQQITIQHNKHKTKERYLLNTTVEKCNTNTILTQ